MSKNRRKQSNETPPAVTPPSLGRGVVWAIALVVVTQGLVLAAQAMLVPVVRDLKTDLEELPLELGTWQGIATELDARVANAIGSDQAINRTYTDPNGHQIGFHSAAWSSENEWTPHPPPGCYKASGWSSKSGRNVTLDGHPEAQLRLQRFTRDGARVVTVYWYQIGEAAYTNREGARKARQSLWGTKTRPPLVKVLLQMAETPGVNSEEQDKQILQFAALVFGHTRNL